MRLPTSRTSRPGLTLLEVLVATAIFVLALGGISQLVSMAGDHALEVQMRNQAARLCQSTLARVQCGELPMSSQGDTAVDEDPDFQWSMTVDQASVGSAGTVNNLWTVNIKVTREMPGGASIESTLTQLVIDPTVVGSTQDATPIAGSDTTSASATSSGTTSSGTTDPSAGAVAAPAKSGATTSGGGATPKMATPAPAPKATTPAPTGNRMTGGM